LSVLAAVSAGASLAIGPSATAAISTRHSAGAFNGTGLQRERGSSVGELAIDR
jgi:hypothetical protein